MVGKSDTGAATPEAQLKAFIDRLDPKNQKLFRAVRTALRKRFPAANELAYDYSSFVVIGYSPNEHGIDSPLSIAGRTEGVQLYFNKGPQLPDPKKLLLGSGKQTRFVWLESVKKLSDPDVEQFIAAALERGVPIPAKGKGTLIIKTNKMAAAKKKTRPKAKK